MSPKFSEVFETTQSWQNCLVRFSVQRIGIQHQTRTFPLQLRKNSCRKSCRINHLITNQPFSLNASSHFLPPRNNSQFSFAVFDRLPKDGDLLGIGPIRLRQRHDIFLLCSREFGLALRIAGAHFARAIPRSPCDANRFWHPPPARQPLALQRRQRVPQRFPPGH